MRSCNRTAMKSMSAWNKFGQLQSRARGQAFLVSVSCWYAWATLPLAVSQLPSRNDFTTAPGAATKLLYPKTISPHH